MWIVSPLVMPWRGDTRRIFTPYVITGGLGVSAYNVACSAKRELQSRGVPCYVTAV